MRCTQEGQPLSSSDMCDKKTSFVLHLDMLEDIADMTDTEKASFLDFVIGYNDGSLTMEDVASAADRRFYRLFQKQFDRDNAKWLKTKAARAEAGKKSGEARAKPAAKTRKRTPSDDPLFEQAWTLYQRKGSKPQAKKYWSKLSEVDKEAIIQKIPIYLADKPEVKFRKNMEGWINPANRLWEVKTIAELEQETMVSRTAPRQVTESIGEIEQY